MRDMMKAVAVVGREEINIIEMTKPVPKQGQILVKVKACALYL